MKWEMWISTTGLTLGFLVGVCALIRMSGEAPKLERFGILFWTVGCATSAMEWVWSDLCFRWPHVFAPPLVLFGDQILHFGIGILAFDFLFEQLRIFAMGGTERRKRSLLL